jgi:hypothetical protein
MTINDIVRPLLQSDDHVEGTVHIFSDFFSINKSISGLIQRIIFLINANRDQRHEYLDVIKCMMSSSKFSSCVLYLGPVLLYQSMSEIHKDPIHKFT